MKLTDRLSYYVLYALFAIIIIVFGIFYFGGEMANPIVPEVSNPAQTEVLLYLMYGILGLTVAITLVVFTVQFLVALKDNPVEALKSLIGIILLAAVLIVSWIMGSGEELSIAGYDGTDNVPFWLKMTDMFLYSIYFLMVVTAVAMLGSGIKKRFS